VRRLKITANVKKGCKEQIEAERGFVKAINGFGSELAKKG
jgi:hypothetical protein